MQNNELNTAKEYLKGHARQRRWRSVVAVLSCLVIICTAYILTQPATTMSTDTFCGMDEHTHSDACFEPVLICGECLPASHEHTSDCYEVQEVLACNQELNEDGTEHTDVYSHILDDDRKNNAQLFQEAFYDKKDTKQPTTSFSLPEGISQETLEKMLASPEIAALLGALAKNM